MPAENRNFVIRNFSPRDRATVRKLCGDTGFLGEPIDPVFEDRQLFADYLTSYYTDREPESSFILEVDGKIRGYLMGARHHRAQHRYDLWLNLRLVLRGLVRYPRYNAASKKFVHWILTQGRKEVPPAPQGIPHFHINLLADARKVATTRALIDAYLEYLVDCGETQVFGQMTTFAGRRTTRMFERYGFRVINKSEITKYREFHDEPVYLSTVLKDLDENVRLYAK